MRRRPWRRGTPLRTARRLAIFGEDTPPTGPDQYRAYWSHGLGWNYRAHELTAALARSGLRRLDGYVATAQRNAEILTRGLAGLPGFVPPPARAPTIRRAGG